MASGIAILGTGSAVPERIVTNDDMAKIVDTSDEWIRERTGIHKRHFATDETVLSLATAAAQKALQAAAEADAQTAAQADTRTSDHAVGGAINLGKGSSPISPISLIICATVTNELRCPSLACLLQRDLQLPNNILAFDLNAACSGWLYALVVARRVLAPGERALIIGSETLSKITNFDDRSTCVLFGDAAAAGVVEGSDCDRFFCTTCAEGGEEALRIEDRIEMDGQAVFKFAVETLIKSVKDVLAQANCKISQIDHFIVHQANARIIASAAKRLRAPLGRFFMNIDKYGNTSAASLPLALDEAVSSGLVQPGHKVVFAGFGGGLTGGAVYMEW